MKIFVAETVINNCLREFCFKRTSFKGGVSYTITVADEACNLYTFYMALQNGQWSIADAQSLPQWIRRTEFVLRNAILSNEGR